MSSASLARQTTCQDLGRSLSALAERNPNASARAYRTVNPPQRFLPALTSLVGRSFPGNE
jgi:hypothetical protein